MKYSNRSIKPLFNRLFLLFLLLSLFPGCGTDGNDGPDTAGVAANNRGVALMGQFKYEEARQVFETLAHKYPRNTDIRVNLAIATLNRRKEGDEQIALGILAKVLEQHPDDLRALYCSGLLELYTGKPERALESLGEVVRRDPGDGAARYFVARALMQLSRYQGALEHFNDVIARDPHNHSAYYGAIMALRQLGKVQEAQAMIGEFQRLKNNPRAHMVEFKYTMMGPRAEAQTIDRPAPRPAAKPNGPLFEPVRTIAKKSTPDWTAPKASSFTIAPTITPADINGDGHTDIFITGTPGTNGANSNRVLIYDPQQDDYVPDTNHPLVDVTDVMAALWGDIGNDGRLDVYLCRRGPNQLWMQQEKGQWVEVAEKTGTTGGNVDTVDGMLFDADHDGDLDIFLVNGNGPNELLNNDRNGGFRPLAAQSKLGGKGHGSRSVLIADLDADQDADIIVLNQSPPHEVYINHRLWEYRPAKGFDAFIAAPIAAAVAADLDTDGHVELYTLDPKGNLNRFTPPMPPAARGSFEKPPLDPTKLFIREDSDPGNSMNKGRLWVADVDGDGTLNLVMSGNTTSPWLVVSVSEKSVKPVFSVPDYEDSPLATWCVVNTVKGPGVVGWTPGRPPRYWAPGPGRYAFALLELSGRKNDESNWRSNASGIGTRLSVRVGSRWTVLDTFRHHSGPGNGLQPLCAGLGGAQHIDFVALDWSDSVYQTELNLAAGKTHRIIETQRQISSCPVLFAWNGTQYEFVSDLLGVGGIGYALAPGEYNQPRPRESFMLPDGLPVPRDGRLAIKLTEPMEEITYLDALRLTAYDLPPGWSMTLDERMGINGPQPTGKPLFYRNTLLPIKAINNRGETVTESVVHRDLRAAPPGPLDRRFIGRLQNDHVLTLTFETLTFDRSPDGAPGQPVLVIDGWVEYPYSQTNFAAWQAGESYRAPTLEVCDADGKWRVLLEQFGYPAGMPRQMALPLPSLPPGVRRIRLTTNQEIYWDRIAVVYALPCPDVRRHPLEMEHARLERVGFPRRLDGPQRLPGYDFQNRSPYWDTRFLEGDYTRFGDIMELVGGRDSAVAIFGAGEGVHIEFRPPVAVPPAGWGRVYVLETDGWCKDMDLYTLDGATVVPLPGTPTPQSRKLHIRYNTRYLSGRR